MGDNSMKIKKIAFRHYMLEIDGVDMGNGKATKIDVQFDFGTLVEMYHKLQWLLADEIKTEVLGESNGD